MKRNRSTHEDLSRRAFIKTTAAGVGAAALAGLSATEAMAAGLPDKWQSAKI